LSGGREFSQDSEGVRVYSVYIKKLARLVNFYNILKIYTILINLKKIAPL